MNHQYLRYKKASSLVRKSMDPTASRVNKLHNISNIIEGIDRKINDVVSSVERAQANYMLNKMNQGAYQPSNPYGGPIGGMIPNGGYQASSRNYKGPNIRSHHVYDHLR
jgi:hypothetical protein